MTEHAPDLGATEARQARRGRHAFVVLVISLFLVVIGLFGAWAFYFSDLAGRHGNREAPPAIAQAVNQKPGVVRQTDPDDASKGG
jgi:hypothetical protein